MSIFWKIGNFLIRLILSSPLHAMMSKSTLLVHFTGRRSGKQYTTPVNYTQQGNLIRITIQRERVWWRNFKDRPETAITLRGQRHTGTAKVLENPEEAVDGLARYLHPAPNMAKYLNVKQKPDSSFDQADLLKAAERRVVIEITLQKTRNARSVI
jgi:deazaflavin-dependent oxidoreductase (nitroreductase family)